MANHKHEEHIDDFVTPEEAKFVKHLKKMEKNVVEELQAKKTMAGRIVYVQGSNGWGSPVLSYQKSVTEQTSKHRQKKRAVIFERSASYSEHHRSKYKALREIVQKLGAVSTSFC